jgi:hypothetical protein
MSPTPLHHVCGAVACFPISLSRLTYLSLIFSAKLNASNRHGRRVEALEPHHWPDSLLDPPMLLFDNVV